MESRKRRASSEGIFVLPSPRIPKRFCDIKFFLNIILMFKLDLDRQAHPQAQIQSLFFHLV